MKIQHSCYRDKKNSKKDNTRVKFSAANFNLQDKFRPPKGFDPSNSPLPPESGFKQIIPDILLQETTVPWNYDNLEIKAT